MLAWEAIYICFHHFAVPAEVNQVEISIKAVHPSPEGSVCFPAFPLSKLHSKSKGSFKSKAFISVQTRAMGEGSDQLVINRKAGNIHLTVT